MKKLASFLECGTITSTHGVRGAVKVKSYCDTPSVLASLPAVYVKEGEEYRKYRVVNASLFKADIVIMTLEGVENVENAAVMKNLPLYADRKDLPTEDGSYFITDIVGLPVIDADSGLKLGVLKEVIQPGPQQIYVVEDASGEYMVPAVSEFIKEISLGDGDNDGGIYVKLIEGMRGEDVAL